MGPALARAGSTAPAFSVEPHGVAGDAHCRSDLDETALFLHRVIADLPPQKQEMLAQLQRSDEDLHGKKVLVVDEDVRNIFALGSVLERHGMKVFAAQTGQEGICSLEKNSDVAIVLMDIMMPEMDGYQTIQLVRKQQLLATLRLWLHR